MESIDGEIFTSFVEYFKKTFWIGKYICSPAIRSIKNISSWYRVGGLDWPSAICKNVEKQNTHKAAFLKPNLTPDKTKHQDKKKEESNVGTVFSLLC